MQIIPLEIDANYQDDTDLLSALNQHLEIFSEDNGNKVAFQIYIAEGDHYITVTVSLNDLLEAIAKARREDNLS